MKSDDRRSFLKTLTLATVGLGSGAGYTLLANGESDKTKPNFGMIFDQNKCVACGDCESSCKKANNVPVGQVRLYIENKTCPETPMEKRYTRVSCQQCVEAPCATVCPSKACHKDPKTGITTTNADDCIACMYCIVACPYDVRFINNETKAADSCNFCLDTELADGKNPACVSACRYNALVFGDLNDKEAYINLMLSVKDSVRQKPNLGTKPSLRYIPVVKTGV